jgi:hypothetical protein
MRHDQAQFLLLIESLLRGIPAAFHLKPKVAQESRHISITETAVDLSHAPRRVVLHPVFLFLCEIVLLMGRHMPYEKKMGHLM